MKPALAKVLKLLKPGMGVRILWHDSEQGTGEWYTHTEAKQRSALTSQKTKGYVVDITATYISITHTWSDQGEGEDALMISPFSIPLGCITDLRKDRS